MNHGVHSMNNEDVGLGLRSLQEETVGRTTYSSPSPSPSPPRGQGPSKHSSRALNSLYINFFSLTIVQTSARVLASPHQDSHPSLFLDPHVSYPLTEEMPETANPNCQSFLSPQPPLGTSWLTRFVTTDAKSTSYEGLPSGGLDESFLWDGCNEFGYGFIFSDSDRNGGGGGIEEVRQYNPLLW